ncbi:hypothetical protein [Prosthecobacter dejongeii]|uniref:Uncharacterized protein n=1 Tax=Prosthecobacter dejongeii TaxID=48465 RepID=A0A7W7YKN7_9BACT|nr:hypothetical protein [Prosthecobacter dejongeii]MBB5037991.1 hypothetical protein [Prosthecobacter dejongeii]
MISKLQAIKDLDLARAQLGSHLHLASEELNPKVIISRSLREHPWIWAGGAAIAGLLLIRGLMPSSRSKIERDNLSASATKGGLIALILSPMLGMVRQAAWKYGSQYLQSYLTQHFSQHEGDRPSA